MKFSTSIVNSLTRRWTWSARLLGLALGFVVLFAAFADGDTYPLWVKKIAYNDAGEGGTVSGSVVKEMKAGTDFGDGKTSVDKNKIVTYAISYGQGSEAQTSGLTFEDSMSEWMTMVGPVRVPTSWASSTSANATVSYTGPLLTPGSTTSVAPTPASISTGTGGGDGYNPIIYTSDDRKTKRFFEIYHHRFGDASINCQNFSDGKACPGYPMELRDTKTKTRLSTPNWVHSVVIDNKVYFPAAVGTTDVGIGCWDAILDTNCAFIRLDTKVAGNWDDKNASWSGVKQLPDKPTQLYLTQAGILYCWDLATSAGCNGKQSDKRVMTEKYDSDSGEKVRFDSKQDKGHTDLLVAGTKDNPSMMFVLINGWLTCADVSKWPATTCGKKKNWPVEVKDTNIFQILSQYLDTQGNVKGACVSVPNDGLKCFDSDGNSLTTPAVFSSVKSGYYIGSSASYGSKVYYAVPFYPNFGYGQTVCWDFATNAACAGFTDGGSGAKEGIRRWTELNVGSTTDGKISGGTDDYGYQFDGQCGYGLGDKGMLWSFDPRTGAAPCVVTNSDITVPDPKAFCDGLDHKSNWEKVQLNNTPTEVQAVAIKVYDAAACPSPNDTSKCTVLAEGDLQKQLKPERPLWEIPFVANAKVTSALSLKQHPSIRVAITYTFKDSKPPASYKDFSATTFYTPDATDGDTKGAIGQVCIRAQVKSCPASVIDNQAIIKRVKDDQVLGRALSTIDTNMDNPLFSDTAPALNNRATAAGRVLYQTTYQVTDWSGDLTAYSTDAGKPSSALWTAAQKLPAADKRNILTTSGTGTGTGIEFLQKKLSDAALANFGSNKTDQTNLINFLRGDRSLEAGLKPNNPYRRRMLWDTTPKHEVTALGDFIHSAPVYDNGMVYAEANDGMLHAFVADTGVESFAFVPSAVFPLLKPLSDVSYKHNWIMDGQVAVARVGTAEKPKSTLIGSTGGVKPALFGIDVSALPGTAPGTKDVLFESTHPALGRANGAIQIATLPGGDTVALLGNGMGSTGDQAQLIQVNIATGDITPISTKTGSASTPNGLSTPTPLLVDGKLVAVYAGDALGNLWRFPVSSTDGIGAPIKLFTTKNNLLTGKNEQPISAAPTVSDKLPLGGKTGGYYIYFGTGKTLDRTDITYGLDHKSKTDEEQAIQALYAVFDVANDKGIPGASGLTPDKLVQQTMDQDKVSNYPVDLGSKSGWFLNLQAGDPDKLLAAERILSPVVYNASSKAVTVVTAFPKENGCYNVSLAGSHFININAATGGQTSTSRIRGAAAGVSQVLVTGSVGGITTGNGVEKGSVNNYTSNGVGGGIGEKTTDGIVLNLRRTSWSQLF